MTTGSVEQCIRDYLTEHGGVALAGDVVAHATGQGHAASTVRRAADRVVEKTRHRNVFRWALRGRTAQSRPVTPPTVVNARAGRLVSMDGPPRTLHRSTPVDPTRPLPRRAIAAPEPEPAPEYVSDYEPLSHEELRAEVKRRPQLAAWHEPRWGETPIELVALLDADDAGDVRPTRPTYTGNLPW